jgi:hypothetical protein
MAFVAQIDHGVITVAAALDAAGAPYRRLGFQLTELATTRWAAAIIWRCSGFKVEEGRDAACEPIERAMLYHPGTVIGRAADA